MLAVSGPLGAEVAALAGCLGWSKCENAQSHAESMLGQMA